MKQWLKRAAVLGMALLLVACDGNKQDGAGKETESLTAIQKADTGDIQGIQFTLYQEGGAFRGEISDAERIEEVHLRLCRLEVGKESRISTLDDGLLLNVELKDEDILLEFEGSNLVAGDRQYEVKNLGSLKSYLEKQELMEEELTEPDTELPAGADPQTGVREPQVKITPTEAKSVTFETYNDPSGYFTLQIPQGWTVATAGDYISFTVDVYDPARPEREFAVCLNNAGFESAEMTAYMRQAYANPAGGTLLHIPEATAESYFTSFFAEMGGSFEVIEHLGTVAGNEVLQGKVAFSDGSEAEGVFSAAMARVQDYSGMNLTMILADNIRIAKATPEDFVDWAPVMMQSMGTLQFTQSFWQARDAQWRQTMQTSSQISQTWNSISDSTMDSWEKRSASYDILMQRQSDATLGYDRVVDTETGETYRAAPQFLDTYDGSRYQPLADDSSLYGQAVSGYIEME